MNAHRPSANLFHRACFAHVSIRASSGARVADPAVSPALAGAFWMGSGRSQLGPMVLLYAAGTSQLTLFDPTRLHCPAACGRVARFKVLLAGSVLSPPVCESSHHLQTTFNGHLPCPGSSQRTVPLKHCFPEGEPAAKPPVAQRVHRAYKDALCHASCL